MKRKILLILLTVSGLVYVIPIAITLMKSLQYDNHKLTIRQYAELLIANNAALGYFWNSLLYAGFITVFCILLSFPLGFLFAKVRFPGRDTIFFIYIVVMLLPFQATLLPNYIQLRDLKLLNTPYALVLPMIFSPFAVFLFRQFIMGISDEILEYTTLETSSVWKMMVYVVIPQLKPAIAALSILIFCESWNMVEQAIIFASESPDILPLSVVLNNLPEDITFAGSVIYMYPVLVVFLLFRNTLQNSMEKFRW